MNSFNLSRVCNRSYYITISIGGKGNGKEGRKHGNGRLDSQNDGAKS